MNFKFGDIVLLKFPFTVAQSFKKRPALIINDFDDDILVCRITGQINYEVYDVLINDWEKSGLLLPSVIRVNKLATLEKNLVDKKLGSIDLKMKELVKSIFYKLIT